MSTKKSVIRLAVLASVLVLLGGGAPGCKKKDGDSSKDKAGEMAPAGMAKAAGGMTGMAPMARAADMAPAAMRPAAPKAGPVTVDADLKKVLAEQFGAAANKGFDKLVKRVEGSQKVIEGLGAQGKKLYPMSLAAAKATKEIAKAVAEGKYGELPAMIITGNVAGLMVVKLLAEGIKSAAKKAKNAALKMNIGGAKKAGVLARHLGAQAKVAGQLLKVYALALAKIAEGKSDALRVALVAAGVKAAAKADDAIKKVFKEFLVKLHSGEKVAGAKAQMDALLKGLK